MKPITLYAWVNKNNPPEKAEYGKGWWDYVEFLYKLADIYEVQPMVVSTVKITTPPPSEALVMPVVVFSFKAGKVLIKHDFGRWPYEFTLSFSSLAPFTILFGLFDPDEAVDVKLLRGVPVRWQFSLHKDNQRNFTCAVAGADEVYLLLWLLNHKVHEKGCNPKLTKLK